MDDEQAQATDATASALMKQGIRFLAAEDPSGIPEALALFDRALGLRQRLPIDTVPLFRYGLAACWLNRADALVRLGDAAGHEDALQAYDAAIELARGLPLFDDPRFPRRLAIAHQNRGLALAAYGHPVSEAIAAFTEAIAVLEAEHSASITDRDYLQAAVWMNLANARAASPAAESAPWARTAALRAIALAAPLEAEDEAAAEVGLKARHVLCRVMARHLAGAAAAGQTMAEDVHEATDAVDDGLGLIRRWERKGVARFRGLAYDLFRFGSRVYAAYQPQFLDEFVRDNVDPVASSTAFVDSAEMRAAAGEALELAGRAPSQ
jgi:hypothetical protein